MTIGIIYDEHKCECVDFAKELTFTEVVNNQLGVMDSTAAAMCRDNGMTMLVFDLSRPDNIYDACMGKSLGTLVVPE